MKYYLRVLFSLFFLFSLSVLSAQSKLDNEYYDYRNSMHLYEQKNDFDSAKIYWEKLNDYGLKQGKEEYIYPSLMSLFHVCSHFKKDIKTLEVALSIHNRFLIGDYKAVGPEIWRVSLYLANYMLKFDNFDKAISYLNDYKNSEYYNLEPDNEVNYLIANILIRKGEVDSALVLMNKHVKYVRELSSRKQDLIGVYNQYGLICYEGGRFEKAILNFRKAIIEIDSLNVRQNLKPMLNGNIGLCYYKLNDYEKAYKMLEFDAIESKKIGAFESHFNAVLIMSKIDLIKNRNKDAFKKIDYLMSTNLFELKFFKKKECFEVLLGIYENQNNLKKSFLLLKSIKIINDSISIMNKKEYNHYITLNSKLLYEQAKNNMAEKILIKEQEKMYLLNELKFKNRNNLYLVIILFLLVVSSAIVFRKISIDRKQNELIRKQEVKIADQNIKIEFEQRNLLEIKIKQKNNRINHQLLELESKKFAADKIIENLKTNTSLPKPELNAARVFIYNELEIKSIKDQSQDLIYDVGVDFIENIKQKHNNLTDKEVKLSIMVALKFSNKEIGISHNLTTATVKNNKNRLKKKMNVAPLDSLANYLIQFV